MYWGRTFGLDSIILLHCLAIPHVSGHRLDSFLKALGIKSCCWQHIINMMHYTVPYWILKWQLSSSVWQFLGSICAWKHELCGKAHRFLWASLEIAAILYLNHWLSSTGFFGFSCVMQWLNCWKKTQSSPVFLLFCLSFFEGYLVAFVNYILKILLLHC